MRQDKVPQEQQQQFFVVIIVIIYFLFIVKLKTKEYINLNDYWLLYWYFLHEILVYSCPTTPHHHHLLSAQKNNK